MNREDRDMLVVKAVEKLPDLDLRWPESVQSAWWTAFERILEIASRLIQAESDTDSRAKAEDYWTLTVESATGESIVGIYGDEISAMEAAEKRANSTGEPVKVKHIREYTKRTLIQTVIQEPSRVSER